MREITVAACLVERGPELLLIRQLHKGTGREHWALPAGKVEAGETVLEGLSRELREETGLSLLRPPSLLYVAQTVSLVREITWTTFTFLAQEVPGDLCPQDPDGLVMEASYFTREEASRRVAAFQPLAVMMDPVLAYLAGEPVAGSLWVYRENELVARLSSP